MAFTKKLMAGGLAALALAATAGAALAAPAYTTGNVNVRSGPGTNYGIVDTVRRGERVEVDQCRGSWCYVIKSGPDGWISANYLDRGRPGRPGWDNDYDRPPHWNPRPPRPPHWDNPRPRPPHWGGGYPRPPRPDHGGSFCYNGPNGYFCVGN